MGQVRIWLCMLFLLLRILRISAVPIHAPSFFPGKREVAYLNSKLRGWANTNSRTDLNSKVITVIIGIHLRLSLFEFKALTLDVTEMKTGKYFATDIT